MYLNTFTYRFPVVQVTIFIVPHSATGNVNSLTLLCRQHSLARQVEFALQPRRPQTSPTRVDTALQTVVFCGVPYLPTTHLHLLIPPPPHLQAFLFLITFTFPDPSFVVSQPIYINYQNVLGCNNINQCKSAGVSTIYPDVFPRLQTRGSRELDLASLYSLFFSPFMLASNSGLIVSLTPKYQRSRVTFLFHNQLPTIH